jgi:hypothetical protein
MTGSSTFYVLNGTWCKTESRAEAERIRSDAEQRHPPLPGAIHQLRLYSYDHTTPDVVCTLSCAAESVGSVNTPEEAEKPRWRRARTKVMRTLFPGTPNKRSSALALPLALPLALHGGRKRTLKREDIEDALIYERAMWMDEESQQ